jgi:hypothetical protein
MLERHIRGDPASGPSLGHSAVVVEALAAFEAEFSSILPASE